MKKILPIMFAMWLAGICAFGAVQDGIWNVTPSGQTPGTMVFQVSGTVLTGTVDGISITGGKVEGNSLWFNLVRGGVSYSYKGTVSGTSLSLSETHADGSQHRSLKYSHS